ncbi:MAG: hypothetical protein KIC76_03245 [Firmicutes bacterium]|nr:hypothetical protein [Bacillota bacterium]
MKNKKAITLSIIASLALLVLIIGATYAYFQASGGDGTSANLRVTTYTTDIITFEVGSNINIETNATLFSQGKGNASGTTFARATLTANNKTNSATENYNLFLNISDNTFLYSVDTNTPELILTIKDKSNNEVTSIEGLTYKTVTDGKGTTIKGFDITNKNGLLTLFNKDITTTSTTVEEWNVTVTFVNYNKDQTKNAGKKFDAQLIISKDNFSDYTPNTINTLSASKSGNNLTVNLNLENGSNPIDKYYYAIEETNGLAILDSKASIKRLSNRLAVSELTYVESNNSSYTFTNIKTDANYNVYAYAVDNKKVKTNTYNYKYTGNYNLPVISKVETSKTSNSITATVTATKGTNNISKYYYSIDNGSTFTESTSNSYTFNNLSNNTNYRIVAKVMDTNGKYSNTYVVSQKIKTNTFAFYLDDVEFKADNNMTWEEWLNSSYSDGWSYKQRIKTYDQLISEGYTRKAGYFPFGTNSETYDRNLLLVVMDNIVNELIIFTTSDVQCKINCSNNISIKRADKINDSFQGVYDFILQTGNYPNISNKELTDNYYWISYFYTKCLTPDTLIDVEEIDEKGKKRRRRKKLKDIKVGDKVICINPFTLELNTDTVVECDGEMNKKHTCYDNWYFSDETIITTIHRHRFYNVENKKFMYMEEWNIGDHGLNIDNEKIELIKHEHIEEEINHCTLFTEKYNNYFANGLLSGNRKSKNINL